MISKGMHQVWKIPIDEKCLLRIKHSESLTKKNKQKRRDAVQNVFRINSKRLQKYNHVAIIDDVLTTGATICALIDILVKSKPNLRITIFTIAIAK